MKPDTTPSPDDEWLHGLEQRGWGGALRLLLDVLEPVGPLAAQVLYVIQPAAGILGGHQAVRGLAQALEEPGGIERLRRLLDGED